MYRDMNTYRHIRRPVGVWGIKFVVSFFESESLSISNSNSKRSESEASRSEALTKAREFCLGGPGGGGGGGPPSPDLIPLPGTPPKTSVLLTI